ncbi:MAG: hypothetical protein JO037_15075 [Actinobacteria bacterium]|nr:hypothetical protein [Actinomycetota bacterium]
MSALTRRTRTRMAEVNRCGPSLVHIQLDKGRRHTALAQRLPARFEVIT